MKKLMVLASVATMLNSNVFAMKSVKNNDSNKIHGYSRQSVDYKKAWTKSHSILQEFIKSASKSENDYEKALNIVNKAYLNVDACDFCGNTLLFTAARLKDPRILIALLDKNPKNINAKNDYGFTAFSWFMFQCYKEDYVDFVRRKADQNNTTNSLPILMSGIDTFASSSFAEYNQKKKFADSVSDYLDNAIIYESVNSTVKKFIEHNADISIKCPFNEYTPFHYAVNYHDKNTVKSMLDYDPKYINELNDSGNSPLTLAILNENIPMIELLVEKGATIRFKDLRLAINKFEVSKALLLNRDGLSKIENLGKILANCPIEGPDLNLVTLLIDSGANVDEVSEYGYSFFTRFISIYKGNDKELIDKVINASKCLDDIDNTDERFKYINPLIAKKLAQAKANLSSKN